MYITSDRKRWFYKCKACGHWQTLSRENLIQTKGQPSLIQRLEAHDETAVFEKGTFVIGCVKCTKLLDRLSCSQQWVTERPTVTDASGYKMSGLDCAWVDGDKVMLSLRDMRPGLGPWMNYELGEEYLGDAGSIPENLVYSLVDADLQITCHGDLIQKYPHAIVVVGIDWGKTSYAIPYAIVSGRSPILLQPFSFTDTNDPADAWKAMLSFAQRWHAEIVVADEGYGQDRNPYLHAALGARFFACRYDTGKSGTDRPMFATRQGMSSSDLMANAVPMVVIGRAPSLKARIIGLRNKSISIARFSEGERWYDLLDLHFRNVAIVVNELVNGILVETAETLGPDHFLHALNYATIAAEWAIGRYVKTRELDAPQSLRDLPTVATGMPTAEDIADAIDILGM